MQQLNKLLLMQSSRARMHAFTPRLSCSSAATAYAVMRVNASWPARRRHWGSAPSAGVCQQHLCPGMRGPDPRVCRGRQAGPDQALGCPLWPVPSPPARQCLANAQLCPCFICCCCRCCCCCRGAELWLFAQDCTPEQQAPASGQ